MKTKQQIELFLACCTNRNKVDLLQSIVSTTPVIARITPLQSIKLREDNIRLSYKTNEQAKVEENKTIEIILIQLPTY